MMVIINKIDENNWSFTIVDENQNPPEVLCAARSLAPNKQACMEDVARLFDVMGRSIHNKGTSPSIAIFDPKLVHINDDDEEVEGTFEFIDLSPELERHDD